MHYLQISIDNRLVSELLTSTFDQADRAWLNWCRYRWTNGLVSGASAIGTSPAWTVPVGACIECEAAGACQHDPIEAVA
jgi:hypothetical protein